MARNYNMLMETTTVSTNSTPVGVQFLTVGSDPEFFVRSLVDGTVSSAIPLISGDKENPLQLANGAISYDNILAELNSKVSHTLTEFIVNHKLIIEELNDYLNSQGYFLDKSISSYEAEPYILSDPRTWVAGCTPDYNAYTLRANTPPNFRNNNLRSAGGHLHIGFDQAATAPDTDKELVRVNMVKALDLRLGIPSLLMDVNGNKRREVYGKAGAYRPKYTMLRDPYDGVEYRTLSNFWTQNDEFIAYVYEGVKDVYENFPLYCDIVKQFGGAIRRVIDTGNKKKAKEYCNTFNIPYLAA